MNEELLKFIKDSLDLNISREEIKSKLVAKGWEIKSIDDAFAKINHDADVKAASDIATPAIADKTVEKKVVSNKAINYLFGILAGTKKFPFLLFTLILTIATSIYPIYAVLKFGLPFLEDIDQRVEVVVNEVFPKELEITIKDGKASTNVTEPYHLVVSQSTLLDLIQIKSGRDKPQSKIRLLTLNTIGSVEDFERFQSLAMLTNSNLVFYSDEGIQIESLRNAPNMVIKNDLIISKIREINQDGKIVRIFRILLYLSPIVIIIGLLLKFLAEFLFGSIIIWFINKILSLNISFGRIYKFTACLNILPALILMIISFIPGIEILSLWFETLISILVLTFSYLLLLKFKEVS